MPTGVYKRKPLSAETKEKISIAHIGKKMSEEARKNMSLGRKGIDTWNKGKTGYHMPLRNGGYYAIHKWLIKHFGKANFCESASCKNISKRFHWALIKGKDYDHKRENFKMLCSSCHRKYDHTKEWAINQSKSLSKTNQRRRENEII